MSKQCDLHKLTSSKQQQAAAASSSSKQQAFVNRVVFTYLFSWGSKRVSRDPLGLPACIKIDVLASVPQISLGFIDKTCFPL